MERVVVVGGGISGLAAAWELTGGATPRPGAPAVTAARGVAPTRWPAAERRGRGARRRPGPRRVPRTTARGGRPVPRSGAGATRWCPSPPGGRRSGPAGACARCPRATPSGSRPGSGPRPAPASSACAVRWASPATPCCPDPTSAGPIGDRAIGPLVSRKLGQRVVDMLVDPLIGGIHAGSVDDMSAAATFPPLLAAAQRRGGLMRGPACRSAGARPRRATTLLGARRRHGVAGLARLAAALQRARRGHLHLLPRRPTRTRRRRGAGPWSRRIRPSRRTPWCWRRRRRRPPPSSSRTTTRSPDCCEAIDYASVVLVTFRVGADDVPDNAARHRVPRAAPQPAQGTRALGGDRVHVPGPQVVAPRARR